MARAKASPNLQAIPTSASLAQTLPSDAVLDALKMILLGAPLNEVLTTITRHLQMRSKKSRERRRLFAKSAVMIHVLVVQDGSISDVMELIRECRSHNNRVPNPGIMKR